MVTSGKLKCVFQIDCAFQIKREPFRMYILVLQGFGVTYRGISQEPHLNFLVRHVFEEKYGSCNLYLAIEVLHGSMVHGKNDRFFFPWEKNVLSDAKQFHCSCHVTWLPCKTSLWVCSKPEYLESCKQMDRKKLCCTFRSVLSRV